MSGEDVPQIHLPAIETDAAAPPDGDRVIEKQIRELGEAATHTRGAHIQVRWHLHA
jgi:hypothetical protein